MSAFDYQNPIYVWEPGGQIKVVQKTWGQEFWLVNNELYCLKRLELYRDYQCSLHRHLVKDETFYVVSGVCTLELDGKTEFMIKGASERIKPGTFHRFSSREGCTILEVSTHHDDDDVERREESR